MSRICGRLREVVAYQRSDHRGSKFLVMYVHVYVMYVYGNCGGLTLLPVLIETQSNNFSLDCHI